MKDMNDITLKYAREMYKTAEMLEDMREIISSVCYDLNKYENNDKEKDLRADIDKWVATVKNGMVHLYIPDMPACLKTLKTKYRNRWKRNAIETLVKIGPQLPYFDKAFILFTIYRNNPNYDLDNVDIKPIIDGISYSGIIKNDTSNHLAYGITAIESDNPHIEVLIFDCKIFDEFTEKVKNMYTLNE